MQTKKLLVFAAVAALTVSAAYCWNMSRVKRTTVNGTAWYDSFDDAQAEAKRTGKPILFFSMFGRLDEEMPCANARTLRATLFKDPEFKKLLAEDVIPAWEMVRAVPKVTIDLGDGKKVLRTVRGNAVMYLCNPQGEVVDAFPGVYTAQDFMPMVRESLRELAHADYAKIAAWHKERGKMIPRTAATMGKAALESPTLSLIGAKPISGAQSKEETADPARLMFLDAARRLSDLSLTPMTPEDAVIRITGGTSAGKSAEELARDILQADSRNNVERVRPVVHLWLASEKMLPTTAKARDSVLETILKIPYKDPYFGLKDVLLPGTPQ